ncbi:MAG: nucleotidyl transferase AbiEii/AbiGii toxin family protein [Steroidobacteraceae bacterium]
MSPDVAASVRARLLNKAKATGEEFERTLARFAAERLLFRLGACASRDRCILKGASLLTVWLPDPYRATRDVDVLLCGQTDNTAIRSLLEEICGVACPEDAIRFDLSELVVEAIRAEEEYVGRRARLRAFLGNARIPVQVDFGVGDATTAHCEEIVYPTLLEALPRPRLRAYPRETSVAEKFEAMVKLDTRNSRMKDFHDLWALAETFAFEGPVLRDATWACFERRGTPWTQELPRALTPAFYQMPALATRWRHYLAAGAVLVPPPAQFDVIGERIIQFMGPVRSSIVADEPLDRVWKPGGPW